MTAETVRCVDRPPFHMHPAAEAAPLIHPEVTVSWLKTKARLGEIPHAVISGKYMFSDQHLNEIIRLFERRPGERQTTSAPRRRPAAPADDVPVLRARRPRQRAS